MGIRNQSNERITREKMWYFSEESVKSYSSTEEEEDSNKLEDYNKIIKEENDRVVPKSKGRNRLIREGSFVVDWQLSDSL